MNHDLKHSPAVATLRRELADLHKEIRRLRKEAKSRPCPVVEGMRIALKGLRDS